jgi:hypothetical protein
VAHNSDNWFSADKKVDRDRDGVDDRAEGAGKGAGIGAGLGGAAGLLAGLGLLAIPGLGPVFAAGWLAATAVGAAAGAATGGLVGALTEAGVSKEDAPLYAEGVRRGGTLVPPGSLKPTRRASMRSSTNPPSTFGIEAQRGRKPAGRPTIPRVSRTEPKRFVRNGNCTPTASERVNEFNGPHRAGRYSCRL